MEIAANAQPDFEELERVILGQKQPERVHLVELGIDGEVECSELNCETCAEKPVCDSLRDIVIKRRKTGR